MELQQRWICASLIVCFHPRCFYHSDGFREHPDRATGAFLGTNPASLAIVEIDLKAEAGAKLDDTATEIGVLSLSGTEAVRGLSLLNVLVFPALFTAGMALVDTADSALMVSVYRWAFVDPFRKLWYNFTITAASVLVSALSGGVEALGLFGQRLGLAGGA